ncbi:MAG: 3-dehydroquinate synthase [Chloroflexi bacterium]|nr:3-dehydroquinate synthase [Chloroflexota bacterium]
MSNLPRRRHVILVGFSGSGKSVAGRKLAARLGCPFVDTDDEIARKAGVSVPEVFATSGEAAFREMERDAVAAACHNDRAVISVGGGAMASPVNREVMRQNGWIICLEASPEVIFQRLSRGLAAGEVPRPLLAGPNSLERITSLKESRQSSYAQADWTIHTDLLSEDDVVEELARAQALLHRLEKRTAEGKRGVVGAPLEEAAIWVNTSGGRYPIIVEENVFDQLGTYLRQLLPGERNIRVVSDGNVYSLYGERVEQGVLGESFDVRSMVVPAGEAAKSLDQAELLYDWLLEERTERQDIIVALGGGTTGDLAGFVAATYLRGITYIQVPTTLLAMVDSAIGGKTGVNHSRGKNLVGAFYQPRLVLTDVTALQTLPARELRAGWAEVIKYGVIEGSCLGILGGSLFDTLEEQVDNLRELAGPVATVIGTCARLKATVVSQDERESGIRTILNYGHTVGHALEAVTNYSTFLHGEAIAIGMDAAARLAERLGLVSGEAVLRQRRLLQRFGLPTAYDGANVSDLLAAMTLDKKSRGKRIQWVLPSSLGRVEMGIEVPDALVQEVLREITAQRG